MRLLLVCLIVILYSAIQSQSIRYVFQNYNVQPTDRYIDIEGSPYYFSTWVKGQILRNDANILDGVLFNYNGFTKTLEAKQDTTIYALDPAWHIRAVVTPSGNPGMEKEIGSNTAFQIGLDPGFGDNYAIILFHGENYMLLKHFDVNKTRDTRTEFAASNPRQFFSRISTYYIRKDGELIKLKTQKKKLKEALGNDSRILDYISTNDLDVKQEPDLIRLVSYANTIANN